MERPSRQDPVGYQLSFTPQPAFRPAATDARGYEGIKSPAELRIALRELRRVRAWINQFADLAAEMPDYGAEGVRAINATAAIVSLLIERAEARLYSLP